jgi:hypothetical protein
MRAKYDEEAEKSTPGAKCFPPRRPCGKKLPSLVSSGQRGVQSSHNAQSARASCNIQSFNQPASCIVNVAAMAPMMTE